MRSFSDLSPQAYGSRACRSLFNLFNAFNVSLLLSFVSTGIVVSQTFEIASQDSPNSAWWRESMGTRDERLGWWRDY